VATTPAGKVLSSAAAVIAASAPARTQADNTLTDVTRRSIAVTSWGEPGWRETGEEPPGHNGAWERCMFSRSAKGVNPTSGSAVGQDSDPDKPGGQRSPQIKLKLVVVLFFDLRRQLRFP